jgi:hypothetical protein
MAEVNAGQIYTVQELLDLAEYDAKAEAAVDYNESGYDLRRVQVGGLPFNDLDEKIRIPEEGADDLEITLDGESVATLTVASDDDSE